MRSATFAMSAGTSLSISHDIKAVTYVLIDQENCNILAVVSETIEGLFDGRVVGLSNHDQKVLLCIGGLGNVL